MSRVNINGQGLEKMCLGVVYSKMAAGAILNLRVNEGSYSQNGFITVKIARKDSSLVILVHLAPVMKNSIACKKWQPAAILDFSIM